MALFFIRMVTDAQPFCVRCFLGACWFENTNSYKGAVKKMKNDTLLLPVEDLYYHPDFQMIYDIPSLEQVELAVKAINEGGTSTLPVVHVTGSHKLLGGVVTWLAFKKLGIEHIHAIVIGPDKESEFLLTHSFDYSNYNHKSLVKLARHIDAVCILYNITPGRKPKGTYNLDDIAKMFGVSKKKIERYRKLVNLSEPFHQLVASNKVGINLATLISKHPMEEQNLLFDKISSMDIDFNKVKQTDLGLIIKSFFDQPASDQNSNTMLTDVEPASTVEDVADRLLTPERSEIAKSELASKEVASLERSSYEMGEQLKQLIQKDSFDDIDSQTIQGLLNNLKYVNELGDELTRLLAHS